MRLSLKGVSCFYNSDAILAQTDPFILPFYSKKRSFIYMLETLLHSSQAGVKMHAMQLLLHLDKMKWAKLEVPKFLPFRNSHLFSTTTTPTNRSACGQTTRKF